MLRSAAQGSSLGQNTALTPTIPAPRHSTNSTHSLKRAEFQRLYRRGREDAGGTEPHGLFNVIEFVMHDREGAGAISLEEAMQIMYLRHGRAQLDAKLEEVFGTSDLNSGKRLGLTEFLDCLMANQIKALLSRVTARSYRPPGAAAGATGQQGQAGGQAAATAGRG